MECYRNGVGVQNNPLDLLLPVAVRNNKENYDTDLPTPPLLERRIFIEVILDIYIGTHTAFNNEVRTFLIKIVINKCSVKL